MKTSNEELKSPQDIQDNQWTSVSDVEFKGDKNSETVKDMVFVEKGGAEKVDVSENLAEIRDILNRAKEVVREKDPEGLIEAQKKDQEILASCNSRLKELENKLAEYKTLSEEQSEYYEGGEYVRLINDKENRERSRAHKVLAFFHRPDKVLENIDADLARADKRADRIRELTLDGCANEEKIEAQRKYIDDLANTATNEDNFLSDFEAPLSREQKDKLLDYDTLAKLSTEEYLKLWRCLNPQYVSHVTRQGYRDHNAMVFHSAGMGKMAKGFTNTLKSGKAMHSFISMRTGLSKNNLFENEDIFCSFMKDEYFKDGIPRVLLESEDLSSNTIAGVMGGGHLVLSEPDGFWRDRTAVHVMANNVGDSYYGAESGNEIFYVFPADVIMSQDSVNQGLLHRASFGATEREIKVGDKRREIPYTGELMHNDVSIYVEDSLPLDAGFVFLPKDVLVDPNTGSKYHDFNSETMTGTVMTKEMGGVSAEDYWKNYFKEHPEEKPAHIIYYNGDPETAVAEMLAKNGIYVGNHGDTSKETGDNLGFDDKVVSDGSELDKQFKEETTEFFTKVADYIRSAKSLD